tara:strand:+ start:226 stop:525 length:300 start_codon:yes stop_codon:yes gene_type:complete
MVVATHGPDTCAVSNPQVREIAMAGVQRMGEAAGALDVAIQGAWANMLAHVQYFLVDAPNAQVVNQLAAELRLMEWNTVVVNPVITMDEAVGKLTAGSG